MNQQAPSKMTCICCGSTTTSMIFSARPLDYCLDKDFDIYRCSTCGNGKTEGVQGSDLKMVYEDGAYDPKENTSHKILRPFLNLLEGTKLEYLAGSKQPGKTLLEVGTGKGNFLSAAIEAGYKAVGIEPSSRSYKMAKVKLNDKVFHCSLEEMHAYPELNRKYDYIFLWHVFEHLSDPEGASKILKSYLKPDGALVIAVPNFDSYQRKLGKKYWYHLDPPRHLFHYTPQSLQLLQERNGMRVTKVFYNSYFQNFLGDIITMNNIILPQKNVLLNVMRLNKFYFNKSSSYSRVLNTLGFALITSVIVLPSVIFTFLSQLLGKSGTMVVVAKLNNSQ